jgi:8-oxo-dGTP diphosphatase
VTGSTEDLVRAGGGVVWRRRPTGEPEILVVHRPKYDDWSLPKGKLVDDEDELAAALREVEEETGLRCEVGDELPATRYRDNRGRPKVVRYWVMRPCGGAFVPNDEVDEVRWVSVIDAADWLTYERDIDVIAAAARTL